ncbi:MAG: DUF2461 domain-containing protein [Melioribacteraceae bacterium]|nr:DUF2461 domain-containing protein [Melioribacteraceae bacterium]
MQEINFIDEAVKFFEKLKLNNNREWFHENKDTYQNNVIEPVKIFIELMGMRLREISPDIIYEARVNKSIFRINRDVRFSKDKSPYKTNLGLLFWEGTKPKMECSGYYFHIDPESFFLGTGFYQFTKETLKRYRETVNNPVKNKELTKIMSKLEKKGYQFGGKHYKKLPRGFDGEVANPDLLLYNGFYGFFESKDLNELKKDPLEYAYSKFKEMHQLHKWLVDNLD